MNPERYVDQWRKRGRPKPPLLSPAEIRTLRLRLNLTQEMAGQLIGGGPKAFTKYESGTVKPSGGMRALLWVLHQKPDLIYGLHAIYLKAKKEKP